MAIDWDEFDKDVDGAIKEATRTADGDAQLASTLAFIQQRTAGEIAGLVPAPADTTAIAELLQIVNSATDDNDKIKRIMAGGEGLVRVFLNIAGAAGTVL